MASKRAAAEVSGYASRKGGDQFVITRAVAPTARPVVRTATAPALTVVLAANLPAPTTVRAAQAFNEKTTAKANTILHEHKIIGLLTLIKLGSHADP
jgi:hypothetical protein